MASLRSLGLPSDGTQTLYASDERPKVTLAQARTAADTIQLDRAVEAYWQKRAERLALAGLRWLVPKQGVAGDA